MYTTAPIPHGLTNPVERYATAILTTNMDCGDCELDEGVGMIFCSDCIEEAYSAAFQVGPSIRSGDLAYALGKRDEGDTTPRPDFDGLTLTDDQTHAVATLVKGFLLGRCHNPTPEDVLIERIATRATEATR